MMRYQKIAVVRRDYNQWVANQTLEDYALRYTARSARRWSPFRIANAALGGISFLALEAIGAAITLAFGFTNAVWAIAAVSLVIFATNLPISYYAAKYGVDIDLLARGAGFGYLGSTVTSLIYASFTFIFLAIEAAIMAQALELGFGLPLWAGYLLSAIIIIPMVTHGITFIGRLQLWTQPFWIALHIVPLFAVLWFGSAVWPRWVAFPGLDGSAHGFDLLLFGAASTVLFALIAQIGEQVDYLRFLPRDRRGASRRAWWIALLLAGPGWIVLGAFKMLVGSFLAVYALSAGVPADKAADPTQMYLVAFGELPVSAQAALWLTVAFVVISQIKINVTNAYAGSIAWSNFFSRLTLSHPGRVVWLVFNVAIALLLMQLGIYEALKQILGLYGLVAVAWVGALTGDLVINKPFGLSPRRIEFKRGHLFDVNPVGVGAMLLATLAAALSFFGLFGETARALSPYVALVVSFALAPLFAWITRGHYYLAREPAPVPMAAGATTATCIVCQHAFEAQDMTGCPAYGGSICSLCCGLDARCQDMCKPHGRLSAQTRHWMSRFVSNATVELMHSRLTLYLTLMTIFATLLAGILSLVSYQTALRSQASADVLNDAFWTLFAILIVVIGVLTWLFVLAREASSVAQEETRNQNALLVQEIDAHERTDAALQRAKEAAEAANRAKSRHIFGLAHELRTPLNAISGYAQLLARDPTIPDRRKTAVDVIGRSADHLASLIESLLDISKIEAGRLQLSRDTVPVRPLLDQVVAMFRLQASAKGLDFIDDRDAHLPAAVVTDEKRLGQILINLLSNAVKFTRRGHVALRVHWSGEVAEFRVEDTGIGIAAGDLTRIFEPFERGQRHDMQAEPGTGLGLTITKLLTKMLGGDISVASTVDVGTRFSVRLYLPAVADPGRTATPWRYVGHRGPQRTIVVVDDDPNHRLLMTEMLGRLGFRVFTAGDGEAGLAVIADVAPDLVLLDLSMPGLDGRAVAERLRAQVAAPAVLFVSANAPEVLAEPGDRLISAGTIAKPIRIDDVVARIGETLALDWIEADIADTRDIDAQDGEPADAVGQNDPLSPDDLDQVRQAARRGHLKGLLASLDAIERRSPHHADLIRALRRSAQDFRFEDIVRRIDADAPAGR
jgi:signal transduction histidine kinase/CheY-like chemotaxis protein/purine-cytosine permease-like protein